MNRSPQQKSNPWQKRRQRRTTASAILIIMAIISFTAGIFSDEPDELSVTSVAQLSKTPSPTPGVALNTPTAKHTATAANKAPTQTRAVSTNTPVLPTRTATPLATASQTNTPPPPTSTPRPALPTVTAQQLAVQASPTPQIEEPDSGPDAAPTITATSIISITVQADITDTLGLGAGGNLTSSISPESKLTDTLAMSQTTGVTGLVASTLLTAAQEIEPGMLPTTGVHYSPRTGYFLLSFILLLLAGGVLAGPRDRQNDWEI